MAKYASLYDIIEDGPHKGKAIMELYNTGFRQEVLDLADKGELELSMGNRLTIQQNINEALKVLTLLDDEDYYVDNHD